MISGLGRNTAASISPARESRRPRLLFFFRNLPARLEARAGTPLGANFVMPGLVPGLHKPPIGREADHRVKPGGDKIRLALQLKGIQMP